MATKAQELITGCFAAARDGEPLFVLRSTDPRAPELVREWARQYLANRVRTHLEPGEGAPDDVRDAWNTEHARRVAKHAEACMLAAKMDAYRNAFDQTLANGGTEDEAHAAGAVACFNLPG